MLQIQNLKKKFSTQFEPVLNGVNLHLERGDFCVILGSNGSGKSTLLKLISGEVFADYGKIHFENQDLTNASIEQRSSFLSMVTQDIQKGTIPEMTMLENLVLGKTRGKKASLQNAYKNKTFYQKQIAKLGLGLEDYLETPLSHLSGGQRQIIALVMNCLHPPQLLLLDEHCSALDPRIASIMMQLTQELVEQNKITTLMVTHQLKDALSYGNRLIMLHKGKILLDLNETQKKELRLQDLLDLFYQCEDQNLVLRRDN